MARLTSVAIRQSKQNHNQDPSPTVISADDAPRRHFGNPNPL
jgi:hypothetical protein